MRRPWPPVADPALLERLALDEAGFAAWVRGMAASLPARPATPAALATALRYPWRRPAASYVLRGEATEPLAALAPGERRRVLAELSEARHPLVAFGSNAAPGALRAKFAHLADPADRTVLVLSGELHDVDAGPAASPALYGALPAALLPSPGTAVRAAVVWLTAAQVTQLTWSEVSYRLGRLDRARFAADEEGLEVEDLFAYVSRIGVLCPDGEPLALAAVPARGRVARAVTQEEALDLAAALVLGPGARAADVVRAVHEELAGFIELAMERLWPLGRPLDPGHWTPLPAGAG